VITLVILLRIEKVGVASVFVFVVIAVVVVVVVVVVVDPLEVPVEVEPLELLEDGTVQSAFKPRLRFQEPTPLCLTDASDDVD
jgi:hypothetical protein